MHQISLVSSSSVSVNRSDLVLPSQLKLSRFLKRTKIDQAMQTVETQGEQKENKEGERRHILGETKRGAVEPAKTLSSPM